MATNSIKGSSGTHVVTDTHSSEVNRTSNSGQRSNRSNKASRATTAPQHVMNIDHGNFDRTAPRGTYLNIVV